MPMRPDRVLTFLVLAALLGGCAATPESDRNENRASPVIGQLAATLPGRYTTVTESDKAGADDALSLEVELAPSDSNDELKLLMAQRSPGDDLRRFLLSLTADGETNRLSGSFAPLSGNSNSGRQCDMTFRVNERGLVGETDPGACRFGEAGNETGLLKEIAFDGRQLVIGDRLVDLDTGEPAAPDRIHEFYRVRNLSGWAGVRNGDSWRIARELELDSGAGTIEPVDAAGMGLGIRIGLTYYRMERGESRVMLRLSVTDSETGELIGESWADPDSRSVGLALPDLQVGLEAD